MYARVAQVCARARAYPLFQEREIDRERERERARARAREREREVGGGSYSRTKSEAQEKERCCAVQPHVVRYALTIYSVISGVNFSVSPNPENYGHSRQPMTWGSHCLSYSQARHACV